MYYAEHHHLADLQWRLLSEIREIQGREGGLDAEEERALSARKLAYNRVIDSLQDYKSRFGLDPMDKLPTEIWNSILKDCMRFKRIWDTLPSVRAILLLSLVSKGWRTYILSEPSFWNEILLTDHHNDTHKSVSMSLFFSRDLPLTLYIDLPFKAWADICLQMTKNRHRI
ncbi:hypothetical protein CPB86DRAFT_713436, partial [Serendipita vermifera]